MTATRNDCGAKPQRLRGVCQPCYTRRRRQGTRDELPPPTIGPGICKRGHRLEGDNLRIYGKRQARFCAACDRDRLEARRKAAKAVRDAAKPPAAPRAAPKPRTTPKAPAKAATTPPPKVREPKPTPAAKPPTSNLPPGWDRVTPPKVHAKPGQVGGGLTKILEVPRVEPLEPEILARAARTVALWFADAPHVADELTAALGLEAA